MKTVNLILFSCGLYFLKEKNQYIMIGSCISLPPETGMDKVNEL